VCGCGYTHTRKLSSIDLSYPEALVAYWRIYWPTQLFGIAGYLPVRTWMRLPGHTYTLQVTGLSTTEQFLFQNILFAVGLFLFVHRFLSSSFHRFSIQILMDSNGEKVTNIPLRMRSQIWFFLWWRHIAAGPVLLKMLIGHKFGDFRFEVKRLSSDAAATASAPSQVST
jgi:hypothetical protein